MKITKKNQLEIFCEKHAKSSNIFLRTASFFLSSSWSLGVLMAALSAWTGGILYV